MKQSGIELIGQERKEQIEKHGRTIEHDIIINDKGQLIDAVIGILDEHVEHKIPEGWDIDICHYMARKPYLDRLIIAGALIAAEIDRINYLKN